MTPRMSIAEARRFGRDMLAGAGVATAGLDADVLLAHLLGVDRTALIAEPRRPLELTAIAGYDQLLNRRARREPLAYIVGEREFWSLSFKVTPATLIPRPDSETVVAVALEYAGTDLERPWRVLDLGTGSGCLLLSLLSELPAAGGLGVDISEEALAVAAFNARRLGLGQRAAFQRSDWASVIAPDLGAFDIVVANPPYVPDGDISALMPEVARYEPQAALAGGADGLAAYRRLALEVPPLLAPGGHAFFEIGAGQADAVADLLAEAGLAVRPPQADLSGVLRVAAARRP